MRKLFPWLIGFLLIALGVFAFIRSQQANRTEVRLSVNKVELSPEQAMDLTLKGVNLSQGKEGQESWKLKAASAQYAQEEGIIQLHKPEITYYLPPDREIVVVTSVRGEMEQKQNNAKLWEDVIVTRAGGQIRSEQLFYTGKTNSLSIPDKARFNGPDMFGTAHDVVWDLTTNILTAERDVDVTLLLPVNSEQETTGVTPNAEQQ